LLPGRLILRSPAPPRSDRAHARRTPRPRGATVRPRRSILSLVLSTRIPVQTLFKTIEVFIRFWSLRANDRAHSVTGIGHDFLDLVGVSSTHLESRRDLP